MILSSRYRGGSFTGVPKPPLPASLNYNHPLCNGLKVCCVFNDGHSLQNINDTYYNYADPHFVPVLTTGPDKLNFTTVGGLSGLQATSAQTPVVNFGSSPINGLGKFSMAMRATFTPQQTLYQWILSSGNPAGPGTSQGGLFVPNNQNTWEFTCNASGGGNLAVDVAPTGTGIADDVVGVYDGAAMRIYKNGIQAATTAQSGTVGSNDTGLFMFCNPSGPSNNSTFNGLVSYVMLWTRALSALEVQMLRVDPYQMFYVRSLPVSPTVASSSITMRRSLAAYGARAGSRQVHRS